MDPARPSQRGLVARALAEAIESVTAPSVRDSILAGALRSAGRSSIPERGHEVLEFAGGPLQRELSRRVGDDTAIEVLRQVTPILQRAATRPTPRVPMTGPPSAARRSPPPFAARRTTRPAGAGPASGVAGPEAEEESGVYVSTRVLTDPAPASVVPLVFLASRDADAAVTLAVRLGGRATVRIVDGLLDLLDVLEEDDDGGLRIVVLDGSQPALQVPSVATVGPELAGRAQVLLWRCSDGDRRALEAHAPGRWRACGATLDDVARACGMLIAPG